MATRTTFRVSGIVMSLAVAVLLSILQARVNAEPRKCIQECDTRLSACQQSCARDCSGYEETCYGPCSVDCDEEWDECAIDAMQCTWGGSYICTSYYFVVDGIKYWSYTECH